MYVAKVNDRGKADYTYMFDDQLFEFGDLLSKSYYMKKSSDLHEIVEFCREWNEDHKEIIKENTRLYYLNVALKGLLQAPALVVLYSCMVFGVMIAFGSDIFHENIMLEGVNVFGGIISKIIIAVYIISAALGLLASISKYDNVIYKATRSAFSIAAFIVISQVFFNKIFFSGSEKAIVLTVIALVGCFFIRVLADHLMTAVIRKRTEEVIREGHDHYIIEPGVEAGVRRRAETAREGRGIVLKPVMNKIGSRESLKQYKK